MPRASLCAVCVRDAVSGCARSAVGRLALAGLKTVARVRWNATVGGELWRWAEREVCFIWPGGCSWKMWFVVA